MSDFLPIAAGPQLDTLGRILECHRIPGESDVFFRERIRNMIIPDIYAIKRRPGAIPGEVRVSGLPEYANGAVVSDSTNNFMVIDGVGYYLPTTGVFQRMYYWARRTLFSTWRKWTSYRSGKRGGL